MAVVAKLLLDPSGGKVLDKERYIHIYIVYSSNTDAPQRHPNLKLDMYEMKLMESIKLVICI